MSTPELVLRAMEDGYNARDTTGYTRLFDAAYEGKSSDASDPITPVRRFYWRDEQRHIQALAEGATISHVSLSFGPNVARYNDLSDPPGWATIQSASMSLEIRDGVSGYLVQPYTLQEFKFLPTLNSASPTDTTWTIIRWTETAP